MTRQHLLEHNDKVSDMAMHSLQDHPILVTGAAGELGGIGRNLTAMLLAKGHKVRALVWQEDDRAEAPYPRCPLIA